MLIDKEKLQELLDTTYELEGLLHLMLSRDDINSTLEGLVVKKLERLSEMAGLQSPGNSDEDMPEGFYEEEIPVKTEFTDISDTSDGTGQEETSEVSGTVKEPEIAGETALTGNFVETSPEMSRKVAPAFSLNDKFLFTRELFNGSREDFNESIDRLAEMETYEEAEGYFLYTLGWNPKDETVMDFMGIVAKYLDK